MTLADLELAAQQAAWEHGFTRNGYAYAQTSQGRLRVKHVRGPEPKKGQRSCWLNNIEISRARAASLLSAS